MARASTSLAESARLTNNPGLVFAGALLLGHRRSRVATRSRRCRRPFRRVVGWRRPPRRRCRRPICVRGLVAAHTGERRCETARDDDGRWAPGAARMRGRAHAGAARGGAGLTLAPRFARAAAWRRLLAAPLRRRQINRTHSESEDAAKAHCSPAVLSHTAARPVRAVRLRPRGGGPRRGGGVLRPLLIVLIAGTGSSRFASTLGDRSA